MIHFTLQKYNIFLLIKSKLLFISLLIYVSYCFSDFSLVHYYLLPIGVLVQGCKVDIGEIAV